MLAMKRCHQAGRKPTSLITLLLEKKANPNLQDGVRFLQECFRCTSRCERGLVFGHCDTKRIRVLFDVLLFFFCCDCSLLCTTLCTTCARTRHGLSLKYCAVNITANAAASSQEGKTALMMAVRHEYDEIVELLVSKTKTDPDLLDKVRLWGSGSHFLLGNVLGREKKKEGRTRSHQCHQLCVALTRHRVMSELRWWLICKLVSCLSDCESTPATFRRSFSSAPTNTVLTTVPAGR